MNPQMVEHVLVGSKRSHDRAPCRASMKCRKRSWRPTWPCCQAIVDECAKRPMRYSLSETPTNSDGNHGNGGHDCLVTPVLQVLGRRKTDLSKRNGCTRRRYCPVWRQHHQHTPVRPIPTRLNRHLPHRKTPFAVERRRRFRGDSSRRGGGARMLSAGLRGPTATNTCELAGESWRVGFTLAGLHLAGPFRGWTSHLVHCRWHTALPRNHPTQAKQQSPCGRHNSRARKLRRNKPRPAGLTGRLRKWAHYDDVPDKHATWLCVDVACKRSCLKQQPQALAWQWHPAPGKRGRGEGDWLQ